MRYAHHNLFKNLKRIKNSKDMTISRELIISEIAKVIVGRPFEVKQILIGCGVPIKENASQRDTVYAVNFNMARNACLRNEIAKLIASNQLPFDTTPRGGRDEFDTDRELGEYVNVTDPKVDTKGMTGSDWTSGISTLLGIGYGIWQTSASRKDSKEQRAHENNLANMNSDLMMKQMELNSQAPAQAGVVGGGGGTSTFTWVILGVGAVAVVIFAVMASRKNRAVAVAPAPAV